jgi:tetratricopeptide (TPR) repeat protein
MSRIEQIRQFLQESPNDSFLRYALAQELQKQGDLNAAREAYLWLTENQPSYVATYYHLGKLLITLGEMEAAWGCYNLGIEHAKAAKELHALSELQSAKLELEYEDD